MGAQPQPRVTAAIYLQQQKMTLVPSEPFAGTQYFNKVRLLIAQQGAANKKRAPIK
jgi:hypothetical protein